MLLLLCCGCSIWRTHPDRCAGATVHDIEQVDDCLKGKTVAAALQLLQVDPNAINLLEEPSPGLRVLSLQQGDSCHIRFYIRPIPVPGKGLSEAPSRLGLVRAQKIIGLSWQKPGTGKRCYIGRVPDLYIRNERPPIR
ncbi:hypothetical protein [Taibaiella koreensis]|uniref:hypothetical protein n=1 Tax=Taibaiella koreensis TaxID=1268548 RepID=UPI000E59FE51|nr:hypothetical protein [Taibaiella koreensis]